jgi:hypothetical protein
MATYAITGEPRPPLGAFGDLLAQELEQRGFEPEADEAHEADLVLNLVETERARPFRRRSRGTFVAALHARATIPDDALRAEYPMLVRALANVVLCYVPGDGVWFTTLERGSYRVPLVTDETALAAAVLDRLEPLARARLVIENEFRTDLEPELWEGDEITDDLRRAGERLDAMGLLPAPFPVHEILGEDDLRHVKRLYGIGGLSYGNLSARKDGTRFWMSASGVDKGKLEVPGRDILLVSGYDEAHARMILSVPPEVEPRRVSVDAIEHWTIYQAHPDVGAILHVHAWVDGISATEMNYPCGSAELAHDVAELVATAPEPGNAVVGLRNHGITATGPSLTAILDRLEARILPQVPMT